ncbi:MAG TPA: 30S ribosome-binding factor RbfA [Stellaceae bacterium]|nr:30S ribosome-binding factor RbfA [Stellaceae bacterium]
MRKHSGKPQSQRQLRVGEELRHILAEVLGRGELRDPDLAGRTVTVTEVRVSPDLKQATAFVVPLGGEHAAEVVVALRRSAPYLRGVVGHRLQLRYAPALAFELDQSFDYAQRIDALLHRPDVAKDLDSPGDGA